MIDEEISKLLSKGPIEPFSYEEREVISPIFIRPKKDWTTRTIINLKFLNEFVAYKYFKIESLTDVINLMSQDCFFAKIDLKYAYFSVSIAPEHRKYLRFLWRGIRYQFTCLCFGLSCAPRFFTKLLKPVVAILRGSGHNIVIYLDDLLIIGKTSDDCLQGLWEAFSLLVKLGFIINLRKSVLVPTKIIEYLGFVLNSVEMKVFFCLMIKQTT